MADDTYVDSNGVTRSTATNQSLGDLLRGDQTGTIVAEPQQLPSIDPAVLAEINQYLISVLALALDPFGFKAAGSKAALELALAVKPEEKTGIIAGGVKEFSSSLGKWVGIAAIAGLGYLIIKNETKYKFI